MLSERFSKNLNNVNGCIYSYFTSFNSVFFLYSAFTEFKLIFLANDQVEFVSPPPWIWKRSLTLQKFTLTIISCFQNHFIFHKLSTIEQWYINSNQTVTDCGFPTPLWYYAGEKYQYSILLVIKVKYILIRCKFLQASQQTNSCHIFCILDI